MANWSLRAALEQTRTSTVTSVSWSAKWDITFLTCHMEFSPVAVMDNGRGPWELVMVRTTCQMPLKLCSDYSLPIWRRTWDHKKRVCPTSAFFHYATFFLVLEFLYFLKINSRQRVHYQPANRLSVLVEMGFKVARRRRGKKWNGFLSLHSPLPPTSLFFASNFFLSYPSMEPNPSLTHFVGMKNIRQALLASCLGAC